MIIALAIIAAAIIIVIPLFLIYIEVVTNMSDIANNLYLIQRTLDRKMIETNQKIGAISKRLNQINKIYRSYNKMMYKRKNEDIL